MGKINTRPESGNLYFDFRYRGKRCREQTALPDTPANRKRLEKVMDRIEKSIASGDFRYGEFFPDSPRAEEFGSVPDSARSPHQVPTIRDFSDLWLGEMRPQWRESHYTTIKGTFDKYLVPEFGDRLVDSISKAEILNYRSRLARLPGKRAATLSADRINTVLGPLRMLLAEAADRYEFQTPYIGIKNLKVPKSHVEPFTIDEVMRILDDVRADYRDYFTVRFFTGMRTSEIHGLQWDCVDFERREIHIRRAWVKDRLEYTKNDGSFRTIEMSSIVHDALKHQQQGTGEFEFVFCNRRGNPLNTNNVTNRIWYPALERLGLKRRRPYQTRHTAATLWLAAGESPEWIARQMGHTTTEMLFRVYSRYVPNLTRNDGSAFEQLLQSTIQSNKGANG